MKMEKLKNPFQERDIVPMVQEVLLQRILVAMLSPFAKLYSLEMKPCLFLPKFLLEIARLLLFRTLHTGLPLLLIITLMPQVLALETLVFGDPRVTPWATGPHTSLVQTLIPMVIHLLRLDGTLFT